ncbi:hypothetical protein AciM339_0379 [Aciduliprofundum sp. MAR08-339]|nr:hypothetical protein AciM339_0379 [Aciduliprofundum sp. MAR08-339]
MIIGNCYICGAPATHVCKMCGRPVCEEHYVASSGLCINCARGKSIKK